MSASSVIATTSKACKDDHDVTADRIAGLLANLPESDPVISVRRRWYLPFRYVIDMLLALVILLISSPVIVIAAALVKLTSRGPMFYRQTRVGKNGQLFELIKLRTMVNNAEALSGAVWADEHDARVTPFGRLLRNTHLDEFPQLINILLGQMSLIGPRPERPEFVAQLEWKLPHYRTRLKLRPGITGLAQLVLPPDTNLDSVRNKLVFDMYYVRCVSPWLDARILGSTCCHLIKTAWWYLCMPFALPDTPKVERHLNDFLSAEASLSTVETDEDNEPELKPIEDLA